MSDDSGISPNVGYPDSSPSLDLIKLPSSTLSRQRQCYAGYIEITYRLNPN